MLDYLKQRGISITNVDTHSLRSGGANALALAGYSDTQIQKMGRWRGATFQEYIRNELSLYADGMSKAMKRRFNFVNIPTVRCVMLLRMQLWQNPTLLPPRQRRASYSRGGRRWLMEALPCGKSLYGHGAGGRELKRLCHRQTSSSSYLRYFQSKTW